MPANAFITNSQSRTLKKRLDELIQHSKELKFLVGFFYFSGWRRTGREKLKAAMHKSVWEVMLSMREEIVRVEGEVDERVKALYGL